MKAVKFLGLFFLLLPAFGGFARSDGRATADIFIGGREGYPTYRIPALVVSRQGTVLAFCEGRKTGIADSGNIDLVLKRSFDGGASWGRLQVIWGRGFVTWGNPAPVVDRDTGIIWLLCCRNNNRVFVTSSPDDGANWAEPREITGDVKLPGWGWYATGPGHAIQLASGRLLVPCDHAGGGRYSHVIYSDDHGAGWKLGGVAAVGTDESMAVETADGRVYLSMRNAFGQKRRAFAWSDDGGLSWSPTVVDPALLDPTCQAGILRYPAAAGGNDAILFLNPASDGRNNLALRVSKDGARSWSQPRTLFPGPAAYSDLTILPDRSVGIVYENGRVWPYAKITFTRTMPEGD